MPIDNRVAHLKPIFSELLRCTMLVRKDMIGNEGRVVINHEYARGYDGHYPADEQVEALLADLTPWLWGERSIMPLLISINDAFDRNQTPNGQFIYNALYICHRLDRSYLIMTAFNEYARLHGQELPEPDIWMAAVGL